MESVDGRESSENVIRIGEQRADTIALKILLTLLATLRDLFVRREVLTVAKCFATKQRLKGFWQLLYLQSSSCLSQWNLIENHNYVSKKRTGGRCLRNLWKVILIKNFISSLWIWKIYQRALQRSKSQMSQLPRESREQSYRELAFRD